MAGETDIAVLLEAVAGVHVLVVGDVMLDRFVAGSVERISPEAPVPVVQVSSEEAMLGGAGNVARNAAALGANTVLVGVVGDDAPGAELAAAAAAVARLEPRLAPAAGRTTTVKTRYFGGAQQLLRADREDRTALPWPVADAVLAEVDAALPGCGAVVVSDYAKGVDGILAAVIAKARAAGKPVVVDPKGSDYGRYRCATVLTPNAREAEAATGIPAADDAGAARAAEAAAGAADGAAVVLTRGRDGMTLLEDGAVRHLRVRPREVFDVSGAGDTVAAALGAALAAGAALGAAAELANLAAGVVVGKVGTAVAAPGEVLGAQYARDLLSADDKVTDTQGALEQVLRWRRAGQKVAFTNGCFDLVHSGHVSLLAQARAAADRLVVGLNTEDSVRRLKGKGRPVQAEPSRAAVMASFGAVDLVVPFGEDTPQNLIEALRPDVLVKGADYTEEQVVGAAFVRSYGGQVLLAELTPGESSSRLVERMAKVRGAAE